MRTSTGASRVGVIAVLWPAFWGMHAHAEDRPLLWAVSKSGDRDFLFRSGLDLDSVLGTSFGAESTVTAANADSPGTRVLPVRLWGDLKLLSETAGQSTLGLRLNPRTGEGRVLVNHSRTQIATSSIDVSTTRSIEASSTNILARQNVKVTFTGLDTAILADLALDSAASHLAYVTVRQGLPLGISLSASMGEFSNGTRATFNARVSRNW